ncbi:unnamed protein product [Lactuca saligna]|uniref:Rhamnogalacturonase A/B/Epimerase-like pectate lyase domain-containing protein n=1 Tax=Lactuca saligna TaxID=75948 RepID=A0AA36DXR1_LACSI|nr:unnamed protein product [Lactuca saligna]
MGAEMLTKSIMPIFLFLVYSLFEVERQHTLVVTLLNWKSDMMVYHGQIRVISRFLNDFFKKTTDACKGSLKPTSCPLIAQPPKFTVVSGEKMRIGCVWETLACLTSAIMVLNSCTTAAGEVTTCSGIVPMVYRNDKISITDFGGIGDGRTLNTKAFNEAIYRIKHLRRRGGTLLYIPPGVYLTQSFNLTSRMTLYLAKGAVIKATQNTANWPLIAPLASYGRGRERPGGRYISFIHGDGLHDVIITGENGTIDGQGGVWWNMWRRRTLQFTRPNLIEFKDSRGIIISNVIFKNSPFWNIHPVYCSNVVIRHVTILAPPDSPNTDGIDPDSSSHVCIEDSYISTGDDLVARNIWWGV